MKEQNEELRNLKNLLWQRQKAFDGNVRNKEFYKKIDARNHLKDGDKKVPLYKGYVETKGKASIEKLKNRTKWKTYDEVKNPEWFWRGLV